MAAIGADKDWDAPEGVALMSRSKYNLIIGLTLVWGFLVDAIICTVLYDQIPLLIQSQATFIITMIVCLVVMIVGIVINVKSNKPAVSFLGYNLAVIPMGILVCVIVSQYTLLSVAECFIAALFVSAVMCVIATIKPEPFRKMGFGLCIALLAALVIELLLVFVFGRHLDIIDWIVAIIFCGYIGFDWVRAQDHSPTLDNAIDSACALYVDIVNLFIRLLEIFGKSK